MLRFFSNCFLLGVSPLIFGRVEVKGFIEEVLSSLGGEGQLVDNFKLVGVSGIEHEFEFAIMRGSLLVAVSLLGKVSVENLLPVLAKKIDTSIPQIVICEDVEEEALKIADENRVLIIKGLNKKGFKDAIASVLSQ